MYDQVVKCQRAGLCLSEHFLIFIFVIGGQDQNEDITVKRKHCEYDRQCLYNMSAFYFGKTLYWHQRADERHDNPPPRLPAAIY